MITSSKYASFKKISSASESYIHHLLALTEHKCSSSKFVYTPLFFFKLKQFPKTPKGKSEKITLYYINISFYRIRDLGLFEVNEAMAAASPWYSEPSL